MISNSGKSVFVFIMILFTGLSQSTISQHLTPQDTVILKKLSYQINDHNDLSKNNWVFLNNELKGKDLVLLGEFNHGSKEVFELRNNMIRYMHESLGFDVILFESGIGELATADLYKQTNTAKQMTYGLFGGWRTKEFNELMQYVKDKNIAIAGFDVQRTGNGFIKLLHQASSGIISDSAIYYDLEEHFSTILNDLRRKPYDSIRQNVESFINSYTEVLQILINSRDSTIPMQLAQQTLKNRIFYLSYMLQFSKDRDWTKRWAARDTAMAANILWLKKNIFPGKKIIVIGHNYHIARYNEKELVMGEILDTAFGKKMYAIGVFAGQGVFANNALKEETMVAADSSQLDIKHIIQGLEGFVNFISIQQFLKAGSKWLSEKIIVNDTWIDLDESNSMILSRHFDGLFLLREVSLPDFNY